MKKPNMMRVSATRRPVLILGAALFAAALGAGAFGAGALYARDAAAPVESAKVAVEHLLKSPLAGEPGKEVAIAVYTFPPQAFVNFVWGLIGTLIGFFRPRYATIFMLAFAAFYTLVASLGTFAGGVLGMELGTPAKVFFWVVVAASWATGINGFLQRRRARLAGNDPGY